MLIVSSPFFDYQVSVGKAFESLGFDVRIETYDEPIHPFKGLLRWQHKFSFNREKLREKSRQKYKTYIESVFDSFKPDIVFTYNGTILKDGTLDYFRSNKAKVVVWMYDSVQRPDRSMCEPHIDHSDLFCCFEERDVEYLAKKGKKSYFLPLACDKSVYYPIENRERDIDILFVGTIYTSPKRIELLEKLAELYPDKNIVFYGEYKPYFKNPLAWLFRRNRRVFKNVNISPSEVNKLFSRCKVALNIHHKQTFHGANQRLFEACGAGAYQICDGNPYIESLFPNGEIGVYHDLQELKACIDWALDPANEAERGRRATAARRIIDERHTFERRVEEMLNKLIIV